MSINLMINEFDLGDMILAQDKLNVLYSGKDWRRAVPMGKFKFAMLAEVSEFLEEITVEWKWYKKNGLTCDNVKAAFELVDIIHFAMSLVLYHHDADFIVGRLTYENNSSPTMYGKSADRNNQFAKALTMFMRSVDIDSVDYMITDLVNLIQTGGELLELKPGDIKRAYDIKNARNQQRVAGGVMLGTYDKSKETELTL